MKSLTSIAFTVMLIGSVCAAAQPGALSPTDENSLQAFQNLLTCLQGLGNLQTMESACNDFMQMIREFGFRANPVVGGDVQRAPMTIPYLTTASVNTEPMLVSIEMFNRFINTMASMLNGTPFFANMLADAAAADPLINAINRVSGRTETTRRLEKNLR